MQLVPRLATEESSWCAVRRAALWIALPAWFLVTSLVSATLLARHSVPLPSGTASDARLATLRPEGTSGWLVVHVLYAKCACSVRIVRHLTERGPSQDARERVLWIGSEPALEGELERAGFSRTVATADELMPRFGIDAAPLLVILDPQNRPRYRGGYTDRKQAYEVRDLELLREVMSDGAPSALPLFGCAVSQRLRELVDPFNLL
jgi:hypothetical protein